MPQASLQDTDRRTPVLMLATLVLLALLALSGVRPYDRVTWVLEVFPVVVAVPVLWATHGRFPLTSLLYACIFVHAGVLMLGGAYSYARVPLGQGADEFLGTQGDPWDTQSDMFFALLGAGTALLLLSRLHDRQLQRLPRVRVPPSPP
jgi:putative membrane protein